LEKDIINLKFSSLPSEQIDRHFGFNVAAIEAALLQKARDLGPGNVHSWGHSLHEGNQTWVGLHPETLQTPYSELCQMMRHLEPFEGHLVDLGAGYGRMALVLASFNQHATFTGFELVKERVIEGQRVLENLGLVRAKLFQQDLVASDFKMPVADAYFLYDYGKVHHIRHTLEQLKAVADHKTFKVIARGKGCRSLIDYEHPWLSQVYSAIHEENFSIYSMG
jgi:hypothetical protein